MARGLCIEQNCDGTVVEAVDFHVGGKDARLDGNAVLTKGRNHLFIKHVGGRRRGGRGKIRTAAFAAVAVERKLADEQNPAADVFDGQIHFAVSILKAAEMGDFVG